MIKYVFSVNVFPTHYSYCITILVCVYGFFVLCMCVFLILYFFLTLSLSFSPTLPSERKLIPGSFRGSKIVRHCHLDGGRQLDELSLTS